MTAKWKRCTVCGAQYPVGHYKGHVMARHGSVYGSKLTHKKPRRYTHNQELLSLRRDKRANAKRRR